MSSWNWHGVFRQPLTGMLQSWKQPDCGALGVREAATLGLVLVVASALGKVFGAATLIGDATTTIAMLLYRISVRRVAIAAWSSSDGMATLLAVFFTFAAIVCAPYIPFCFGACSSNIVNISASNVALALVFAPVAETFLFQGCVYEVVRSFSGNDRWWPALLGSSVLFVASHGMITLELVVAGVALGMLRRATRRLAPVAIAHALINAIVIIIAVRS